MAAKFELTVQQQELIKLRAALKAEADAKKLEAEIRRMFRVALAPLVPEVQHGVLEYHQGGLASMPGTLRSKYVAKGVVRSLGQAVAANVKVGVNLSGRYAGARIYISKKYMPRGFANAPRDLNRLGGWEHPNFHGGLVRQFGPAGYFDKPIQAKLSYYRTVCQAVMDQMAARIATRSR